MRTYRLKGETGPIGDCKFEIRALSNDIRELQKTRQKVKQELRSLQAKKKKK
jgi:hypothetical protein